MMKIYCRKLMSFVIITMVSLNLFGQKYSLKSPDGSLGVSIEVGKQLFYSVEKNNLLLIAPSRIGLILKDGSEFGKDLKVQSTVKDKMEREITKTVAKLKFPLFSRQTIVY